MHPPALAVLMKWLVYSLMVCAALAGDSSADLRAAAVRGDTSSVQSLIQSGANVDGTDKNDRTALMLAAQHGHADTVRALLAAGAKTEVRDKSGLTAYGLALLDPAGHGDHEGVLKLLPPPPRFRLTVITGWSPARLVSSCFQRRDQIIQQMGLMRPDVSLLRELQAYAKASGKGLAQMVQVDAKDVEPLQPQPTADADAVVTLELEPGSACTGGTSDSLTFAIGMQVFRARDRLLLTQKTLGGGVKGLRAQTVDNAAQYKPVYETWMKAQIGPIYWAVAEAMLKSTP
jgi:Ankyrin repeats (3 copies)